MAESLMTLRVKVSMNIKTAKFVLYALAPLFWMGLISKGAFRRLVKASLRPKLLPACPTA